MGLAMGEVSYGSAEKDQCPTLLQMGPSLWLRLVWLPMSLAFDLKTM